MNSRSPRASRKSIVADAATVAQMAALGSGESQEAVRVFTRVRPFNGREIALHAKTLEGKPAWEQYGIRSVVEFAGNTVSVLDPEKDWMERNRMAFDGCMWSIPDNIQPSRNPFATQESLFNEFGKPMLEQAWKGFNTCFLAYGQTGSGKTYSMMGQPVDTATEKADPGLIPRLCQELFRQIEDAKEAAEADKKFTRTFKVTVQYYEIYNEMIKDLLWSLSDIPPAQQARINPENLKIRGNQQSGVYVEYLTSCVVTDWLQMLELIDLGNQCRTTASTSMNERSSRSHAVFKVTLNQTTTSIPKRQFDKPTIHSRDSQINMVDLAGSERNKKTGAVGDRLKEAGNINKSLSTLKLVIDGLVEQSRARRGTNVFIPYRDSTLTYMLMDSLGGNSKTFMLITVSPHSDNIEETTQSLQYGAKARQIVNTVRVNENRGARYILDMEEALSQMRDEAQKAQNDANPEELEKLQQQIKDHEQTIVAVKTEMEAQKRKIEELEETKHNVITARNRKMMAEIAKVGDAQTKKVQASEMEHTLRREVSDLSRTIVTLRNKQEVTLSSIDTVNENIAKLKDQATSHRYAIQQLQRHQADASSRCWELKKSEETTRFACQKAAKDRIDYMLRTRLTMARDTLAYNRKRRERQELAADELQQLQEVVGKQRHETEEQQAAVLATEEAEESALRLELKKLEAELESANGERERQLRLVSEKYAKLEEENANAIKMKESHCAHTKTMWGKRRENMTREIENQYRDVLTKSRERHEKEQIEAERTLKRVQAENAKSYKAHEAAWEARVGAARIKNTNDLADAKTRWENLLNDRRRQMAALRHQLRDVESKEDEHVVFSKKVASLIAHAPKPGKGSSAAAVKLYELLELYHGQYEEDRPNRRHLATLLTKDVNPNRCADPPALGLDESATCAPRPSYPALAHHSDPNEPSPASPAELERSLGGGRNASGSPQRPASLRRRSPSFARRPRSPVLAAATPATPDGDYLFAPEGDSSMTTGQCSPNRVPTPTRSQMYSPQTVSGPSTQVQRRSATPSRSALFFSARLRSKAPTATVR